jgi:transposase
MKLSDFARGVPDDVWRVFEPVLPARVWAGNGRKPYSNRQVLHALLYVLASGIAWDFLPAGMPCGRTVRRRVNTWLACDAFHAAWARLAQRHEQLRGVNWDRLIIDGPRKPAKKGANPPAPTPPTAASAVAVLT